MNKYKRPDFSYEEKLWEQGRPIVCGADEVGRGALAGPVVAAVVSFSRRVKIEVDINDSKKLSATKRELAAAWIKKNSITWAIGSCNVKTINDIGIVPATQKAFRIALMKASKKINSQTPTINYLLVDAFYVPYVKGLDKSKQLPIIKGDSKSISIAAASIIAKVYRDKIMCDAKLNENFSRYQWHKNKGYGTATHREAILAHGPSPHHRKLFIRKIYAP